MSKFITFVTAAFSDGMCIGHEPWLVTLSVIGNLAIALAYFSISYQLVMATRNRLIGPIIGPVMWYLFSAFIALCGLTHLANVVIIWYAICWEQVTLIMMTATAAMLTALRLSPTVSRLLRGRPRELFDAHRGIELSSPYMKQLEDLMKKEGLM